MSYTDYTHYSLDPLGRPRFFGIYSGTVINNSDPSSANRLQISVPQITGDDFLNWAEPSLKSAVVLPAVGDKVWVTFESGDTSYPVWISGSNSVADAVYGAFSSYVDQSATTVSPRAMQFEKTDEANGVSIESDDSTTPKKTRITFATAGTYNLQFSAQFQNTHTQDHDVYIWLRKKGSSATGATLEDGNVGGSTGLVSVPSTHGGSNGHTIAGWNFVLTVAAGDYYEFMWQSDDVQAYVTIQRYGEPENSQTGATKPSTASIVLTVTPVISAVAGSGSGGSGSVTSITAASPLTGGTITSSGTIGLDQTAIGITTSQVVGLDAALADLSPSPAGTYGSATVVPQIVVDAKGRTTSVTGVNIPSASTAPVAGIVALTDATNSSSTTTAATPNSVKTAYDLAYATSVKASLLYPAAPTNFPNSLSLTVGSTSTVKMAKAQASQTQNGTGYSVAVGTSVSATFVSTYSASFPYATSTLYAGGPGNSGTLKVSRNGSSTSMPVVTFAYSGTSPYGSSNSPQTASNNTLTVSTLYDYGTPGFWKVINPTISGTAVSAGWNNVGLTHNQAGSVTSGYWYYDSVTPSVPTATSGSLTAPATISSPSYSSGVAHYTTSHSFTGAFTASGLVGDTYLDNDNSFITTSSAGAFAAQSFNYVAAGITTPATVGTGSVSITGLSVAIRSGWGIGASSPGASVNNVRGGATTTLTAPSNILYKTGTNNFDESYIPSTIGSAARIGLNSSGDTPATSGVAAWSSNSSVGTNEAKFINAVIKYDSTNYSTGYYPVGSTFGGTQPDYSGHTGTQYFTFRFSQQAISKFTLNIVASGIAGIWVAMPGSGIVTSASPGTDWMSMTTTYGGAGKPGTSGSGGNGSDGCALGTTVPTSTALNGAYVCTFGTASSTSSTGYYMYVRIKLASGQSISSLSITA